MDSALNESNKGAKKILFFATHATYFYSHRIALAISAIASGAEVYLFCASKISDEKTVLQSIRVNGVEIKKSKQLAGSSSIIGNLKLLLEFASFARKVKPDLVHCISIKAMLIGLLYKKLGSPFFMIFAVSGLGTLFTDDKERSHKKNFIRFVLTNALRSLVKIRDIQFILQNYSDYEFFDAQLGVKKQNLALIHGSGVDLHLYRKSKLKKNQVVLASRLLSNKGIIEYLHAIPQLKEKYNDWNFILAGSNDKDSPASFDQTELEQLISVSGCDYYEHVDNIAELLLETKIFLLPSYREGFPKVIMEACAAGCAVVATDVPGCREALDFGRIGLLIKPRNALEVELTLGHLIENEREILRLAALARQHAIASFGTEHIIEPHLEIYGMNKNA